MKKYILVIITLFLLCSCSTDNNTSTSASKTDADGTMQSSISASTEISTTVQTTTSEIPEAVPQVFPEDEVVRAFVNALENHYIQCSFGMLYDFDFDGIPEFINNTGGADTETSCSIYKFINGTPTYVATIIYESISFQDQITISNIELYYDKAHNKHFYVAEYAQFDKMANSKYVKALKYEFINNECLISTIAQCEFEILESCNNIELNITSNMLLDKETTPLGKHMLSDLTCFYDGLQAYLDSFEKLETFKVENMTAGIYDNIYDNLYDNYYNKNQN